MSARLAAALLLWVPVAGCISEEDGHTLTLSATLTANADGQLAFLSPTAAIATHAPAAVIGKPYFVGVFPAGFSPGNDPALYQAWGTVPDSLAFTATTTPTFAPGAYDTILVIYTSTPISAAQLAFEEAPSMPANGDLSAFTLSSADVLPGDPDQAVGTLRMNVIDADVRMEIANRTPTDLDDRDQTAAAFEHTILIIP